MGLSAEDRALTQKSPGSLPGFSHQAQGLFMLDPVMVGLAPAVIVFFAVVLALVIVSGVFGAPLGRFEVVPEFWTVG